jgi:hypothetical protein
MQRPTLQSRSHGTCVAGLGYANSHPILWGRRMGLVRPRKVPTAVLGAAIGSCHTVWFVRREGIQGVWINCKIGVYTPAYVDYTFAPGGLRSEVSWPIKAHLGVISSRISPASPDDQAAVSPVPMTISISPMGVSSRWIINDNGSLMCSISSRSSRRVPLLPVPSSPAGRDAVHGSLSQHLALRGHSTVK